MPHEPRKLLSCLRGVNVINRHVEQLAHRCRHVAARGTLGLRHRLWNAAANANQNSEPWEQARAWLTSAPGRQRRAASTSAAAQTLGANLRKHPRNGPCGVALQNAAERTIHWKFAQLWRVRQFGRTVRARLRPLLQHLLKRACCSQRSK